jgi:pimeloyl-ACP methyl ester carboxylesterase
MPMPPDPEEPRAETLLQATRRRATLPVLAGRRAFRTFCTPSLSSHRAPDHERLAERARFHLREASRVRLATRAGEVAVYVLEPDGQAQASVLLTHGWTGEAAFMSAFGDYLRRRGFRSILPDLPAHGASPGLRTSLIDCAHAVGEVVEALGPVRFAVGHSIGALAVLAAGEGRAPMPRAVPFEAYVLVSMPDRFADVTRTYGAEQGLTRAGLRTFERRLERLAERKIAHFRGARLLAATGRPALLIHARDDAEVPFADALRIAGEVARAELRAFDGLGHRAILYAPPAVKAAAAFIARYTG